MIELMALAFGAYCHFRKNYIPNHNVWGYVARPIFGLEVDDDPDRTRSIAELFWRMANSEFPAVAKGQIASRSGESAKRSET